MILRLLLNTRMIQYYFAVPKNIKQNSTHYLAMKVPIKRELQPTPFNHSSDTDFQDFLNFCNKCTKNHNRF